VEITVKIMTSLFFQHLANLDYLIPYEYIDTLQELFDNAPVSSYESVRQVILEELGRAPEELFDDFSVEPIASASLAQVHVAYDKVSGKKLAIKVQHRGLRETSQGDLFAVYCAVRAADFFFKDFTLGWLIDEILPQLPKELNFIIEGKNAERAAQQLRGSTDIVIPKVIWEKTTQRVLCMEFEEGFKCTDIQALDHAGLKKW
jgi:aarF domain-containing kinase